ncbi:hypothetical protein K360107B91_30180 [Enterocloster bolteae]
MSGFIVNKKDVSINLTSLSYILIFPKYILEVKTSGHPDNDPDERKSRHKNVMSTIEGFAA